MWCLHFYWTESYKGMFGDLLKCTRCGLEKYPESIPWYAQLIRHLRAWWCEGGDA